MKFPRILAGVAVLALYAFGIGLSLTSHAQTPPTRDTPCNAATPWDAVCVMWSAVTTYSDGQPIPADVALSYRVEQRNGTAGAWATVATVTTPRALVSSLAPGVYFFRVFVVGPLATSSASNVTSRGVTTGIPSAPVITIAVVIAPDGAPVLVNLAAYADGRVTCEIGARS
jgi:hypothetical protein